MAGRPKKKLTDPQKAVVVQLLACYLTPTDVVKYVSEEWGTTITRQGVQRYDPMKANGQRSLAKKWVDLFVATRKAFLTKKAEHAVSHLPYRLGIIQRVVDKALKMGNYDLVLRALEQAAKDDGGSFTNRQRVDIDGNIRTGVMKVPMMPTREEVMTLIAEQQSQVAGSEPVPN